MMPNTPELSNQIAGDNSIIFYVIINSISFLHVNISVEFLSRNIPIICYCAQSHLTLCNPLDCSPPGSSVHGIFQARILEWVAISSSRGSSDPGVEPATLASPALKADSLPAEPSRNPIIWGRRNFCRAGQFLTLQKNSYPVKLKASAAHCDK